MCISFEEVSGIFSNGCSMSAQDSSIEKDSSSAIGRVPASELTPPQIVEELDRFVIGQADAKRAVAIALRNRVRRMNVPQPMRDEIAPKNIIMIGPTGVGKTEISRRLAKLSSAPFIKVEASKFTEVGYVGRDVESIIRDLVEIGVKIIREEERLAVEKEAERMVEDKLIEILFESRLESRSHSSHADDVADETYSEEQENSQTNISSLSKSKLKIMLRKGELDSQYIEIDLTKSVSAQLEIIGPPGFGEIEGQLKDMFANMVPRPKVKKKLQIGEARKLLKSEYQDNLLDEDKICKLARQRVEQSGIVFIDEIDKICGSDSSKTPDVSREGVQRDLLPIVEGSTVSTKHGQVRTDHILFIASGAFHTTKPSDLMPEFQGRFPIRVNLKSLTKDDFFRILSEPEHALTKQYSALLKTEGVDLCFTQDGVLEIASIAEEVNTKMEDIGARRLHTLLEKVLDEVSFDAEKFEKSLIPISIDAIFVRNKLRDVVEDVDLSRFIL